MSLDMREEGGGKVLVINVSGRLTKDELGRLVRHMDRLVEDQGGFRILCEMHYFHGWEEGAMPEDFTFDHRHLAAIERLAFIGDRASERGMAAFHRPFAATTIRYFEESKANEAREWIYAGLPAY